MFVDILSHSPDKAEPGPVPGPATVATPAGPVPIGAVLPGDVLHGSATGTIAVAWTGWRRMDFGPGWHAEKPVIIPANALAPGRPDRDLAVSPHHRILLATGDGDALIPAKALIGRRGVWQVSGACTLNLGAVLCDRHAVIRVNAAAVESFYPGRLGLAQLGQELGTALQNALPGLSGDGLSGYGRPAHPILNGFAIDAWVEALDRAAGKRGAGKEAPIAA